MTMHFDRVSVWIIPVAVLLALAARAQPANGAGLYGSCNPLEYERLRIEMEGKCRTGPLPCTRQLGCDACRVNFLTNEPCLMAQQLLLELCFRGENEELKKRLKEHNDAQRTCYDLLQSGNCEPEEVAVPLSEEEMLKDDVPFTGPLRPPGDCTKVEYRKLQREVGTQCRTQGNTMRCEDHMDCIELRRNLSRFEACTSAREHIMVKCFRGGDEGHKKALERASAGKERCVRLIELKCKPLGPCKACKESFR